MQTTAPTVLDPTNYFPTGDYFDVYCPHLGAQLGPCEQCDDPEYLAWCEETRDVAELFHSPLDYDSRAYEGPGEPEPCSHIPTWDPSHEEWSLCFTQGYSIEVTWRGWQIATAPMAKPALEAAVAWAEEHDVSWPLRWVTVYSLDLD